MAVLAAAMVGSLTLQIAPVSAEDAVTTLSSLRVEGRILTEDDQSIIIDTLYGQLRFLKVNLSKVERNVVKTTGEATIVTGGGAQVIGATEPPAATLPPGAEPPPVDSGNPFGDPAPAGGTEPAAVEGNPFAEIDSARTAAADPEVNPFAEPGSEPIHAAVAATPPEPIATPAGTPRIRKAFKIPARKAPPAVEPGRAAVVYGLTEEAFVEVRGTSTQEWGRAIADTQLDLGSEVRTGETPTSRLLLRGKKDELRLPAESQIEIETLSPDGEEVTVLLHRGSLWSEVEHRAKPDSFRVRTPELTAGVRGTNFRVDRVNGASKVSVYSGTVLVTATRTGTFVALKANEAAVVNASGQIMDLIANPVDEKAIWDTWDQWAQDTTVQSGGSLAGGTVVAGLSQQIAADNARWEADMQEYARNVAETRYQDKLNEYSAAFLRFAEDTGNIPESGEGWSFLKFDSGLPGWKGPYIEGPIPPLDPWKRPLIYRKVVSNSGRIYGRVYSLWQDGRDQGGVNSSLDKVALVLFDTLDVIKNNPKYAPKTP